VQAKGAIT
jgi:hypothetical protein